MSGSTLLVLAVGAILTPGQRMIISVVRVIGLSQVSLFQRYHLVLDRDGCDLAAAVVD